MYPDSEILFPPRCIDDLADLRGPEWQELVQRILSLPNNHKEVVAFGLMMCKMGSCLTCDLDSYRASLGCCTCAQRTISGFKGDDDELLERYHEALDEVEAFIQDEDDLPLSAKLLLAEDIPPISQR